MKAVLLQCHRRLH